MVTLKIRNSSETCGHPVSVTGSINVLVWKPSSFLDEHHHLVRGES